MSRRTGSYTTLLIMISATMLGKVLGMVRDMLLAYNYGTGMEAKAFIAASRLPLNFFDFALGAVVSAAFIPTFSEVMKKKGEKVSFRFANEFISLVFAVAVLLSLIGVAFAPFFVKLIAGGYDAATYELTVSMTRIMFPMLIFTAMAFAFVGILQSLGEFTVPAAISVVSNLIMILYLLLLNDRLGIQGMAYAMLLGWCLQMLVQVPFLWKKGLRVGFCRPGMFDELKKVGLVMIPILISTWVQPINVFVNTYLASGIDDGSAVAILEYANKVFVILAGVIVLAIANLVFPSMAKFLASGNKERFATLLQSALRMVIFYMSPLTVGVVVFSDQIIQILYGGGAFTDADIQLTSLALVFYGLGIVFYGFREIVNKAFYAYGDSRTPMNLAIIGIIINILFSLILVKPLGINGLALSSSISALAISIALTANFNTNKIKIIRYKEMLFLIKALTGSLLMGVGIKFFYQWLSKTYSGSGKMVVLLEVMVGAFVGVVIYFGWAKATKMKIPGLKLEQGKE